MTLKRYGQFSAKENMYSKEVYEPINENLDKAKKLMRDRELILRAAKDLGYIKGEIKAKLDHNEVRSVSLLDFTPDEQKEIKYKLRSIKLSEDEVKRLEKDSDFMQIRNMLGQQNVGWLYSFTYFYFIENISLEVLSDMYNRLLEYKGVLDRLPKKFDHAFIDPTIPNNYEKLVDGMYILEGQRKSKKVYDSLTPLLKKEYKDAPVDIKKQIDEIADGFDSLGREEDDPKRGEELKNRLWKSFFGENKKIEVDQVIHGVSYKKGEYRYFGSMSRYKNLSEFIKAAKNYIKASSDNNIMQFYEKIAQCNEKFGSHLGAEIIFDDNSILILDIKSFHTNQLLNGHTRHCTKDNVYQWDNYVTSRDSKQYYIYNFNLESYDVLSVIGVTIDPNGSIYASHDKIDGDVASKLKSILKKWQKEYNIDEDLFSLMKPMTAEEIKAKASAKEAERTIVKAGITIEEIKDCVFNHGADINKSNAKALENAVVEDNLEKVKFILEIGGNPNLGGSGSNSIVNKAVSLDVIKLLVSHQSVLTNEVYRKFKNDYEAIEYFLEQGIDPNFDRCILLRDAIRGTYKSNDNPGKADEKIFELWKKYNIKIKNEDNLYIALKWAGSFARVDILKYLLDTYKSYSQDINRLKRLIGWIEDDTRSSVEMMNKTIDLLNDYIEKAGGTRVE